MRQRGGQVLGVGGGHERPGPAARAAAVALAVLCGAARVRGQVAGRRGTPQRTTAASATRLVRRSSRRSAAAATTATAADPSAGASLPVNDVASPTTTAATVADPPSTAAAAAQPQQQQLRDVGDGRGRHQSCGRSGRDRPHHPVVRPGGLSPSPPPSPTAATTRTAAPPSRSRRLPAPTPARRWCRQPVAQLAARSTGAAAAVGLSRRCRHAPTAPPPTTTAVPIGYVRFGADETV